MIEENSNARDEPTNRDLKRLSGNGESIIGRTRMAVSDNNPKLCQSLLRTFSDLSLVYGVANPFFLKPNGMHDLLQLGAAITVIAYAAAVS